MLQVVHVISLIDRIIRPKKLAIAIHGSLFPRAIINFSVPPCVLSPTMHFIFMKLSTVLLKKDFPVFPLNSEMEIEKKRFFHVELRWMWIILQGLFDLLFFFSPLLHFFFYLFLYGFTILPHFLLEFIIVLFPSMPFLHSSVKYLSTSPFPTVVLEIPFIFSLFCDLLSFSMFVSVFPVSYILIVLLKML